MKKGQNLLRPLLKNTRNQQHLKTLPHWYTHQYYHKVRYTKTVQPIPVRGHH